MQPVALYLILFTRYFWGNHIKKSRKET